MNGILFHERTLIPPSSSAIAAPCTYRPCGAIRSEIASILCSEQRKILRAVFPPAMLLTVIAEFRFCTERGFNAVALVQVVFTLRANSLSPTVELLVEP